MTNIASKKTIRVVLLVISIAVAFTIASTTASAMTKTQKAAEKEMLESIVNHGATVNLKKYNLSQKDLKVIQEDICYQHPEAFNVKRFRYSMSITGKILSSTPIYKIKDKNKAMAKAKKLAKVVKSYKVKGSQAKKVKKIHDKLIKNVRYKSTKLHAYDAVGALLEKKAVCQGYAMAFTMIARNNGIKVKMVMNKNHDHAWNVVKIGSRWYNVDVTWDDKGSKASRRYLLVSDSKLNKMDKNHRGRFLSAPKCTKNYKWK